MNSEKTTTYLLVGVLLLSLAWNSVRKAVRVEADNILEIIENQA